MPERAGIFEIEEFYRMLYIPNTNPQNWMEWLRLPEEKLALADYYIEDYDEIFDKK